MKFIKKAAMISALCMTVFTSMTNIMATEQKVEHLGDYLCGFRVTSELYTTSSPIDYVKIPEMRVYQENRSSGTYLCVSVNEPNATVYIDESNVNVFQEDRYRFACKITRTGWYNVRVRGYEGGTASQSIYISANDHSTSLSLSKEYRGNGSEAYLVIKASDDDGIKRVTVNDNPISFNEYSGEVSYRVYDSRTYTVTVTDKNNHTRTESIYISMYKDSMSLNLSKINRSNKCYLVIKADSDIGINQVTVNGSTISFPSSGGTVEYEVTQTGNYSVKVRDKEGYYRSDSIYINLSEVVNTNIGPNVTVTQNYKLNNKAGWYLLIAATDDGSITSVTVNGESVPFDVNKGRAEYFVPVDGTYTIVVTDNDGNSTTKSTFAAGNAGLNLNGANNTQTNTESTTVIFKLNSKAWSKDGITQSTMNVAPKMINSRVYLPIRYIAYALGIESSQINWNSNEKTVTINTAYESINVKVGSKNMYVNNNLIVMDAVPIESGGRVMLPISQIKSAFSGQNIQLDWNNNTKQLTIRR